MIARYRSPPWLAQILLARALLVPMLLAALLPIPLARHAGAADAILPDWQAAELRDHPLVGTIWSPATAEPLSRDALAARLRSATYVLLGEVHDNPDHHRIQAWAVATIASHRRAAGLPPPAIVFEQIRADQRPALEAFARLAAEDPAAATSAELFRRLDWPRSGWPDERIYAPVFQQTLQDALPIHSGDPPRGRTRSIAREGLGALSADEQTRFGLATPLPQALADALSAELKDSHCGMLPAAAIPGMALAQRYRDAHLADALIAAGVSGGGAALIAGNGHVRADRGVPLHLRTRAPSPATVAVMILEVTPGRTDPAAYLPPGTGAAVADIVVFTPRAQRPDPCEDLRQRPATKR